MMESGRRRDCDFVTERVVKADGRYLVFYRWPAGDRSAENAERAHAGRSTASIRGPEPGAPGSRPARP